LSATASADSLLETAPNDFTRARLLATSTKESGACRNVMPITALGPRMDNHTLRVAVNLSLGTTICTPHQCQHYDEEVDCYTTRGLSCCCTEGRHHRHATVNSIVHKAFISAKIPSWLEWSTSLSSLLPVPGYVYCRQGCSCCRREESQQVHQTLAKHTSLRQWPSKHWVPLAQKHWPL